MLIETPEGRLVATGYRLAAWDTPLWALPNRRPGRYNRSGEAPTQYLGLHPLTPWAELLRFDGRRTEDEVAQLRPPVWALRVELEPTRTLELSFDNAGDWGLTPAELVSDDRGATQALAARLRQDPDGPRALIVPSASLPGTQNLVLLGVHVRIEYDQTPLDETDIATALAAIEGRAPIGLVDAVHFRGAGDEHPALAAWRAGETLLAPALTPRPV